MKNIDPRHLTLVLAVTRHGSFNRAADALGMSQPALSKSIALLERRIGAKVFERGPHGSILTPVGQVVALRGENLEHLLGRMHDDIDKASRQEAGSLVIGATPSTMPGLVPDAVIRLTRRFPSAKVTVVEGLDDHLAPLLDTGEIDVLVGPVNTLPQCEGPSTSLPVAEDHFFVTLPRGHPKAKASSLSVADLSGERWLLPNPGSSFHRAIEALFITAGIPWPRQALCTNSIAIHARMVASGGFVGIATSAQMIDRDHAIALVPLSGIQPRMLGLRKIARHAHSAMVKIFEECLILTAAELGLGLAAGLDPL